MKTLVLYDKNKDIVFIQKDANSSYKLICKEVPDDKEVIGIDDNNEFILADKVATAEENEQLQLKLEDTNKELEVTKKKLLDTQAKYVDVIYNGLLKDNNNNTNN